MCMLLYYICEHIQRLSSLWGKSFSFCCGSEGLLLPLRIIALRCGSKCDLVPFPTHISQPFPLSLPPQLFILFSAKRYSYFSRATAALLGYYYINCSHICFASCGLSQFSDEFSFHFIPSARRWGNFIFVRLWKHFHL